jgi:hypothetical protein
VSSTASGRHGLTAVPSAGLRIWELDEDSEPTPRRRQWAASPPSSAPEAGLPLEAPFTILPTALSDLHATEQQQRPVSEGNLIDLSDDAVPAGSGQVAGKQAIQFCVQG